ncbi:MAG: cation:proton antiporter [Deltaproteobacteria bacterium]|nr:cation:proton antiporter [Deltaproteobacteria bacterium]
MMEHLSILFDLFLIFFSAKVFSYLFEKIRIPPMIGEIAAGLVIGAGGLSIVRQTPALDAFSELGAIMLLFVVGLHTRLKDMLKIGLDATIVAVLGVVLPLVLGYFFILYTGHRGLEALFVATALVATSVGITARVLKDMRIENTVPARLILGAAVADDILGLLVLAVITGETHGSIDVYKLLSLFVVVVLFLAGVFLLGGRSIKMLRTRLEKMGMEKNEFILSMTVLLGLSFLTSYIGMASIVGAFFAGLLMAELEDRHLDDMFGSIYEFLVPFFFVMIGMKIQPGLLLSSNVLLIAVVYTIIAIVGKYVGCGIGAARYGARVMNFVGLGMVPRGEVGMIVALIGLNMHVVSSSAYAIIIFMVVATTIVTPLFLSFFARHWYVR